MFNIDAILGNQLFGDLFSMEKLGLKIARDEKFNGEHYRDVWLAEMTGGPNTECSECPNYGYSDLVDYYWPALIGGVLKYSGKDSVDYVSYSAGAGVGAISYEKYYRGTSDVKGYYLDSNGEWAGFGLPSNFVNHMVLIAPMGAFDGATPFTYCIDKYGRGANEILSKLGHFDRKAVAAALALEAAEDGFPYLVSVLFSGCFELGSTILFFDGGGKVSYNFWEDITDAVHNKSDENPRLSEINELMVIKGAFGGFGDDGIVPDNDIRSIYDNSNANEKIEARIPWAHADLYNKKNSYNPLIAKFLNDKEYTLVEDVRFITRSEQR